MKSQCDPQACPYYTTDTRLKALERKFDVQVRINSLHSNFFSKKTEARSNSNAK